MRKLLFVVTLLLPMAMMAQTTYYVSSSGGDDSKLGTSESQAWKTLNKVNNLTPRAGDKILFKRGDAWEGTITPKASGTSGSPITYGAYGTGEKPKIYGSTEITGWTLHSGNIYKATVSDNIDQVFFNGEKLKAARYPNSGYFNISNVNSSNQFTSTSLNSGINYTGAKWIGRTITWALYTKSVSGSSGQTITLDSAPTYSLGVNEGFFLTNKLEFLDQAGEWYYSSSNNTLYVWTPSGDSPANYQVRGSYVGYGTNIYDKDYVTIENLQFLHHSDKAVNADYCSHLTINNNIMLHPENFGIYVNHDSYGTYTNNIIAETNQYGIRGENSSNSIFSDNQITDIGLFNKLGVTGTNGFAAIGISVIGDNNTFRYNRIIGVGYNGISWRGQSATIEYNYIKDVCLTVDDGGAIYTFNPGAVSEPGSQNSIVRYNVIDNVPGNSEGYTFGAVFGAGIYMDERTHDVLIEHNVIANVGYYGIYLHQTADITIQNNIGFSNGSNIRHVRKASDQIGNIAQYNTFCNPASTLDNYGTTKATLAMQNSNSIGLTLNYNEYVDHHRTLLFRDMDGSAYPYLTFSEWKSAMGMDTNSTFDGTALKTGETEKLFYNDTKQDKTFDLGSNTYRDIDGNSVTGKLTLKPFTGKILIGTKFDGISSTNQAPVITSQTFKISEDKLINDLIGLVAASDPDQGQTLTYSITSGNEAGLFSINSANGEIYAKSNISVSSGQTIVLGVKVTDNAESPLSATASITIQISSSTPTADTSSPSVSSFSIPVTSTSLTIAISTFTASDNQAVAGYKLTESASSPLAGDNGWTTSAPTAYTFSQEGTKTLYAWAKDAAGNVSSSRSATVTISLPDLSPSFSEYLFEESAGSTVVDSQGSNDGTIMNTATRTTGVDGNGLELSGTGYISLGEAFGDNVQSEVTLSAWVKPTSVTGGYQGIIMHGGPNVDTYALYIRPDTKTVAFKTSGTSSPWMELAGVNELWDGNWHNLTVTYDGAQKIIYLDGVVISSAASTGLLESGQGYNLLIGAGRDDANPIYLYQGLMDEVRIYNTALSSAEVRELSHLAEQEPVVADNQQPVIQDQVFEIRKNYQTGALAAQVVATDADQGQVLSYAIVQGNTGDLFSLDAATGQIFVQNVIETTGTYAVPMVVEVTDNAANPLSASANVTINIVINGKPVKGEVTASNPKRVILYYDESLQSTQLKSTELASDFSLNGNKKVLQVTISGSMIYLDLDSEYQYGDEIIVSYTKGSSPIIDIHGNEIASFSGYVVINNIENTTPQITNQVFAIQEATAQGTIIGQVTASGPSAMTYAITGGNGTNLIDVDPVTGELFVKTSIRAEDDQSVFLNVEVTDNAANPTKATATITVNIIIKSRMEEGIVYDNNRRRVILTFSEPLIESSVPQPIDFQLSNGKQVESVTVTGAEVILDVDSDFQAEDQILVSYEKGVSPLYDLAGNEIDSFSGFTVDNNILKNLELDPDSPDVLAVDLLVFPNPTNGAFTLRANNLKTEVCEFALFNMTGKQIMKQVLYGSNGDLEENFSLTHLERGTYIVRLICEDQASQSKIVII
ncbi:cadherin domain-containing protein [Gaoshiqia sediminis]|uniref:Cadherin domain-containing protein n=1 Tax=Gaoshiqia sediminis TaxID=2986998 RepID=A0AA41YBQ9_9BACT|nr:cadherin domain-containing protein [Gaoshiqia sediminis]MCW0483175.1 cadherin domain-containing protein [Gaoshiqia sediminis]